MKLRIRILKSESGVYQAICLGLPGCVSRGHTKEEAAENIDEAIRGYLAAVDNFVPEHVTHEVVEV